MNLQKASDKHLKSAEMWVTFHIYFFKFKILLYFNNCTTRSYLAACISIFSLALARTLQKFTIIVIFVFCLLPLIMYFSLSLNPFNRRFFTLSFHCFLHLAILEFWKEWRHCAIVPSKLRSKFYNLYCTEACLIILPGSHITHNILQSHNF